MELRFKRVNSSAKSLVLRGEGGDGARLFCDSDGLLSVLSEDNFKVVSEIVEPFKQGFRIGTDNTHGQKLTDPTVNAGIYVPRVGPPE